MRISLYTCAAALVVAPGLFAQNATFTTFGTGCAGTGGAPIVALPSPAQNTMGNSNNIYGVAQPNMRYQQIFDGKEVGQTRVFFSHSYRMRNASYTGGMQTLEIKLCETTMSPASASGTFASNITSTQTTVFTKKSFNYPNMVPNTDPGQWNIVFKYDVPFIWKALPNTHLLVEVLNHSTSNFRYYADAFSGSQYNVTRIYSSGGVTAASGTVGQNFGLVMGFSFAGGGGAIPVLSNTGRPIVGQSFSVDLSKAKASTGAALIFGISKTTWGAIPLPLDLSPLGAPGCNLLASVELLLPTVTDSSGNGAVNFAIPNNKAYLTIPFETQYLVLDAAANSFGLAFSNGGSAVIGAQ